MLILNNTDELNDLGVDKSITIDNSNTLYVNVILDKPFNDAKELLIEEIKFSILEGINDVFDSLSTIEIMGNVNDVFNNTDTYLVYGNETTINQYNLSDINNYKFIINNYMSNNELVLTSPFYNYTISDELISFPYNSFNFAQEFLPLTEEEKSNIWLVNDLSVDRCVCKCKCKRDINVMGNICTCDNKCTCVKTFTIPIDGMSKSQAKKEIAKLILDYNEDIDLNYEYGLYCAEISITFELNNIKKIKIK